MRKTPTIRLLDENWSGFPVTIYRESTAASRCGAGLSLIGSLCCPHRTVPYRFILISLSLGVERYAHPLIKIAVACGERKIVIRTDGLTTIATIVDEWIPRYLGLEILANRHDGWS